MSLSKPASYDQLSMENAVAAVMCGVGIRCAAHVYQVSKSTLSDRIHHGHGYRRGPKPFLGNDLEDHIAAWIIKMARIGYGQTKEQIKDKVQELVKSLHIKTPWPDDRPLEKWYKLFMKRHPVFRYKMSQALVRERCGISYTDLAQWFDEL